MQMNEITKLEALTTVIREAYIEMLGAVLSHLVPTRSSNLGWPIAEGNTCFVIYLPFRVPSSKI